MEQAATHPHAPCQHGKEKRIENGAYGLIIILILFNVMLTLT